MITESPYDTFNVAANVATFVGGAAGGAVIIVVLFKVRNVAERVQGIAERLEQVLAPRVGIEGYLNMCERAVECDPDGTCIVNDDGEIVLINKAMEDISGYHRSELVGQSVETLVPNEYRSVHPGHREGFVTGPSSRPMRGLKLRHKRGTEVAVGINLNHYRDASGSYTIAKVRIPDEEWAKRSSGEITRLRP